ncbi:hypothetical protein CI238_12111 [Colletotrichum incanum]|uniref:Uncharacterized protein n=1 Tax=Colletotrichum incanum TaxID=1573173 RepID=A0A167ELW5_COLIC|nr:hypothetical protein CI238_12111 [Colletotrichum incanum]
MATKVTNLALYEKGSSKTTVKSTNTANGQFLNRKAMRSTLIATLSLRAKMQNLPELGDLHQAIGSLRVETKTANQTTIRDTRTIRVDIQQNTVEFKAASAN